MVGERRVRLSALLLFFALGTGAALYLHWPALTHPLIYKSDVRQAPHWVAYHHTSFRPGDLLLRYAAFNESPVQNLLYYLGTFWLDALWMTKLVAVVGYGLAAALFYLLGCAMLGRRGGALASLFFTFFPDQFDYFAGGFSKAWMIPLLLVCLYLLERERWEGLLLLMPFSALAYPMAAVLEGMTVLVYLALGARERPRAALRGARFLALAGVLALVPLGVKYLLPPAGIGPMTSSAELRAMPEMFRGGLNHYLPVPPLGDAITRHLSPPFVLGSALLFFLLLGRAGVGWKRSWTALLLASAAGYLLAGQFFMHLYVPNRYTRYSIPLLLVLWHAHNWDRLLDRIGRRVFSRLALGALLVSAAYLYHGTFRQGKDTIDRSRRASLCRFLAHQPRGILVAGHPRYMDDIPVQARRSVLCNYKLAHPWFRDYYREIRRRTEDTFRALYAVRKEEVNRLFEEYGVTRLVVVRRHFERRRIRAGRVYVRPFDNFIRRLTRGRRHFLLESPPPDSVLYQDQELWVVQLPLP